MSGERWAQRLHRRLLLDANIGPGPYWPKPGAGIVPAARWAYDDLADRGGLHTHVEHVRSSQAFALNLFAPLDRSMIVTLLQRFVFDVVEADPPRFEWEDRLDRMHEATAARPHRTQVDVLLRGRTAQGRTVTVLVEVKLSETDLNPCSAYQSRKNDTLGNCLQDGLFGGDPKQCFQLRNRDLGTRRAYDTALGSVTVDPHGAGCCVRGGANQAMRNLALAQVIAGDTGHPSDNEDDEDGQGEVYFVLCAPLAHRAIWRRWDEVRQIFPDPQVASLPADDVVALHAEPLRARLAHRYLLEPPAAEEPHPAPLPLPHFWENGWPDEAWRELASWQIATRLHERHPGRFRLAETHPGGGQYDCLSLYPTRPDSDPVESIQINRVGSIHLFVEGANPIRGVWERLGKSRDTAPLVAQIERLSGLSDPAGEVEPNVAYHLITTILARAYATDSKWRCLNGYLDSSGYSAGPRTELLDLFPQAPAFLEQHQPHDFPGGPEPHDFPGGPAYRLWFLGPSHRDSLRPIVAIESTGQLLHRDGSTTALDHDADLSDIAANIVSR